MLIPVINIFKKRFIFDKKFDLVFLGLISYQPRNVAPVSRILMPSKIAIYFVTLLYAKSPRPSTISSPRKSSVVPRVIVKTQKTAKKSVFKTVPEKARKSKGKVESSNPSNTSVLNGVKHTKYNDVKELIRTSKESIASYSIENSIEKTWDGSPKEQIQKTQSEEKSECAETHGAQSNEISHSSLVVDVAREVAAKISSTIRDLGSDAKQENLETRPVFTKFLSKKMDGPENILQGRAMFFLARHCIRRGLYL